MELRIELNASWLETGFDLISLKIDSSRHQSRVLNLKLNLINPVSMPLTLIIKHSPNPAFVFVSCLILLTYCYNNFSRSCISFNFNKNNSFLFQFQSFCSSKRVRWRLRREFGIIPAYLIEQEWEEKWQPGFDWINLINVGGFNYILSISVKGIETIPSFNSLEANLLSFFLMRITGLREEKNLGWRQNIGICFASLKSQDWRFELSPQSFHSIKFK